MISTATAVAHPNIAFIKYWGNRNDALRLPANGSISMNLAGLETRTSVEFDPALVEDEFTLQGVRQTGEPRNRVAAHLDLIRSRAGNSCKARVDSRNTFPPARELPPPPRRSRPSPPPPWRGLEWPSRNGNYRSSPGADPAPPAVRYPGDLWNGMRRIRTRHPMPKQSPRRIIGLWWI